MNIKADHCELYEKISELIDYCHDSNLPQTKEILTAAIVILAQEEGKNNSMEKDCRVHMFPMFGCAGKRPVRLRGLPSFGTADRPRG